ncbi:MAG: aldo/keto reductase [Thermomicrobiales bacterium]|nr:aldo/keto reductase [Thermomicrobiales bacterium]
MKVSRMALGLGLRGQKDEAEVERMIRRALDLGVNLFDCANVYGLGDTRGHIGKSEEILGRTLKSVRDEVVITSKVSSPIGDGPNDRGGSRYHIMREVERSLKRLDTDHIDVYILHVHNDDVPLDEQFRALENLVQQGKIRYVGVSNYQAWQVCRAINIQDRINASQLITVQNPYSLMDRELEREMFPFCRASGVGVMAYSPLGVGLLSGAYRPGSPPPAGKLWTERGAASLQAALNGQPGDVLRVAFEIAERLGVTVAQLAQQWVMTHPEVSVVVMGANTAEQVDDNLGAFAVELTADDLAALDQASKGLEIKGW